MVEIERDGRVGIDLKFGTILFQEDAAGPHAVALIDVIIPATGVTQKTTRVQMEVKVPIDPEAEPILAITEKCRGHIIATLRAAADTFDVTPARALLFHGTAVPAG